VTSKNTWSSSIKRDAVEQNLHYQDKFEPISYSVRPVFLLLDRSTAPSRILYLLRDHRTYCTLQVSRTYSSLATGSRSTYCWKRWKELSNDSDAPPSESTIIAFAKWMHLTKSNDEYQEVKWIWPKGTSLDVLADWTKLVEEAQKNSDGFADVLSQVIH
jgi:hypothetical protein